MHAPGAADGQQRGFERACRALFLSVLSLANGRRLGGRPFAAMPVLSLSTGQRMALNRRLRNRQPSIGRRSDTAASCAARLTLRALVPAETSWCTGCPAALPKVLSGCLGRQPTAILTPAQQARFLS